MISAHELRDISLEQVNKVLQELEEHLIDVAKKGLRETVYSLPNLSTQGVQFVRKTMEDSGVAIAFQDVNNIFIAW